MCGLTSLASNIDFSCRLAVFIDLGTSSAAQMTNILRFYTLMYQQCLLRWETNITDLITKYCQSPPKTHNKAADEYFQNKNIFAALSKIDNGYTHVLHKRDSSTETYIT